MMLFRLQRSEYLNVSRVFDESSHYKSFHTFDFRMQSLASLACPPSPPPRGRITFKLARIGVLVAAGPGKETEVSAYDTPWIPSIKGTVHAKGMNGVIVGSRGDLSP